MKKSFLATSLFFVGLMSAADSELHKLLHDIFPCDRNKGELNHQEMSVVGACMFGDDVFFHTTLQSMPRPMHELFAYLVATNIFSEDSLIKDSDAVLKALEERVDLNQVRRQGITLLGNAASNKDLYAIYNMLKFGLDPLVKNTVANGDISPFAFIVARTFLVKGIPSAKKIIITNLFAKQIKEQGRVDDAKKELHELDLADEIIEKIAKILFTQAP